MKTTDVLEGKITLEAHEHGISGDCDIKAGVFGRALLFDSFCRALKMYNPLDSMSMIAIITAGGIDKLVGSENVAVEENETTKVDRIGRIANETDIISRGGLAVILGHDYGTEYRFDVESIKEMMEKFKKEGTLNDSN